jgi:hypothetical protein
MAQSNSPEEKPDLAIPIPELPPNLQPPTQTVDEVAAELKKSPFFMTSPSDALDGDNIEMEAIRALMYEGTRAEVAEGFRESGNELAKQKKWSDAKEFYTKGIVALREVRKESDPSGDEEDERERKVREACFVNRALCNLELSLFTPYLANHYNMIAKVDFRELSILWFRLPVRSANQPEERKGALPSLTRSVLPSEIHRGARSLQDRSFISPCQFISPCPSRKDREKAS